MSIRWEEGIAFWDAAVNGDEEKIRDMLGRRVVDINMKFKQYKTILHAAASYGHKKLVDFLCKQHFCIINSTDSNGWTPLCAAVSKNHIEVVKVLLSYGADTRGSFKIALDHQYRSLALILAKYGTLLDICSSSCPDSEFLVEILNVFVDVDNVNVNARIYGVTCVNNFEYSTPFHCAVANGREQIVKRLIDSGADVNAKSGCNVTPLYLAVRNKDVGIVECLLNNGADVNCATNHWGNTALCLATHESLYLVDDDPSSQERFADYVRIIEMLLENGASVNFRNSTGLTPLHYAVQIDQFWPDIVRLLLDYGADVNGPSGKYDAPPIFYARNEMILWILINRGANVNHAYKVSFSTMFTPLSQIFHLGRSSCVEVLIRNGADVNIRNSAGKTLLETYSPLVYFTNLEILETIINQTTDLNPAIRHLGHSDHDAASPDNIEHFAAMIVKRKVSDGLKIDLGSLDPSNPQSKYRDFCSSISMCEMEIIRMKKTNVDVRNFSVFNILDMSVNKLSEYAERKELLKFESDSFKEDFPIYAKILNRHIEKARRRRSLIDLSAQILDGLIFRLHEIKLPDLVLYTLIHMVNDIHLYNFVQV